MAYIDCYLVPVPRANREKYEELARISCGIAQEYGALRVLECWLDESGPETSSYHAESARQDATQYRTFAAAAGAGAGETVVMSWVEWPDKKSRDEGMAKLTADPRMQFGDMPPVFDGKRLLAAGFHSMLDSARHV